MSRRIEYIVVHHSASPSASTTVDDITQWHLARGFKSIGYHYIIDSGGFVYAGRTENTTGAHVEGYNAHSIGICLIGNYEVELPTGYALQALRGIVQELRAKYPGARVVGHKDLGNTLCPGTNLYPHIKEL